MLRDRRNRKRQGAQWRPCPIAHVIAPNQRSPLAQSVCPLRTFVRSISLIALLVTAAWLLSACDSVARRIVPAVAAPPPQPADAPFDPQIELSPKQGYVGTYVNVRGEGWKPGEMVLVVLADARGRSNVLAASIADSSGAFNTGFLYPVAERWLRAGSHRVVAHTDAARESAVDFQVTPPEVTEVTTVVAASAAPTTPPPAEPAAPTPIEPAQITPAAPISSTSPTSTTVDQPDAAAVPVVPARTRPTGHGLFVATQTAPLLLDGSFAEWAGGWNALDAIVWGADQHSGRADLSGEFQARWALDGLYLAVRVRDDRYRSGPAGTDLWQGDSLEIHLDRRLEEDFADAGLSQDDYQIGISAGPELRAMRAYRWIPYEQEAALSVLGVARPTASGYAMEVQIPWSFFGVQPQDLASGTVFGFNLSISDNDGDAPAQQTIASASPARTDHQTPTEWGTLLLE